MRIAFYYSFPRQRNWNDLDLEGFGLPGSETALVHLTRELARAGNAVTVYNRTSRGGFYNGVLYKNLASFNYRQDWDIFIAVRGPLPDLAQIKARVKLYWSIEEDGIFIKDWKHVLPYLRAVITISPFHTHELCWRTGLDKGKVFETRLGIAEAEYRIARPKYYGKMIYCSVPHRGLGHFATIYPLIKKAVPEASLVVTGGYSLWGEKNDRDKILPKLSRWKGVRCLGRISREQLITEQKSSMLHVYPCSEAELFCLPSIECQAAGVPTVATTAGALASTVENGKTGLLIPADMLGNFNPDEFAQRVIQILRSPEDWRELSKAARTRAFASFTYRRIAGEWLEHFKAWCDEDRPSHK